MGDRVLVGKPKGRRPLGRPRRRWTDNIKIDFQGNGFGSRLGFCGYGQGQVTGYCQRGDEQLGFMKCGEFHEKLRHC